MLKRLFVVGALLAPLTPVPVQADQTGMAAMHDIRRERGKKCMTDHFHSGSSAGERTRNAAKRAAMASWSSFTALEYGSDWARPSRAASKAISCKKSGSGWGCYFEARPCL